MRIRSVSVNGFASNCLSIVLFNQVHFKAFDTTFRSEEQRNLVPYYKPVDSNDKTLVFESRFESGNLEKVTQVFVSTRDLILGLPYQ